MKNKNKELLAKIKEDDLNYLKRISKVSVKALCKKYNLSVATIYTGYGDIKKIHKIREEIESYLNGKE